jgi:lambda repressor-like predicted transcriptional regulator
MKKAKILETLIKDTGLSMKSFSQKCGIPYTTLYTILKNGVGRASLDNIVIICKNLGIHIEDLEAMASGEEKVSYEPSYEDLQSLIARNGKNLTIEQKQEIIKSLLSDN